MVLGEPVTGEAVRRADSEVIPLDGEQSTRADPGIDHRRSELVRRGLEESSPKAIQH
jgi:hypothetical protein